MTELEATELRSRRRITVEIWLLLGVSLGLSGLSSFISLLYTYALQGGLSNASTTLNPSQAPDHPWFDLAFQLLDLIRPLSAAGLAIYLLSRDHPAVWRLLGLDFTRPGRDLRNGVGLAALIGIPGLGFYLGARALGLDVQVIPAGLEKVWWAVPVLILSAIQNGIYEEVIVVGYLTTRLNELKWRLPTMILASAVLRGSYHLYQGFGGFAGNFIMGIVFAFVYRWWGRVMPLIIAHSILDIGSFVGYYLLASHVSFLH